MERFIPVKERSLLQAICGIEDRNLKSLEKRFRVKVFLLPEGIRIKGNPERVNLSVRFIEKMLRLKQAGVDFSDKDLEDSLKSGHDLKEIEPEAIKLPSLKKKFVLPKTSGQEEYINSIKDYDIVIAVGPAGTGKTYLAIAMAVNYLLEKKVRRIILTRPAREAGETLGFLPGGMQEKLAPYLRPMYDALYDMLDAELIEEYLETGIIEVAPLAYMRGRTLNNAFVILDEAQNCTAEQLKMFLTRLGFDSKAVITGDITQSDLPGGKPIGLIEAIKILKLINGIKFISLTKKDVVRHHLIQQIIQAYEDFYAEKGI